MSEYSQKPHPSHNPNTSLKSPTLRPGALVAEKVIQRLWARGAFTDAAMRTLSGKPLRLVYPGTHNTREGPDFREAVWELAGTRVIGDVEIHFYREDWRAHGHDRDPAFDAVALHVVVSPRRTACRGVAIR